MSEQEYKRLEAEWRADGSPVGFNPRCLLQPSKTLSSEKKKEAPA